MQFSLFLYIGTSVCLLSSLSNPVRMHLSLSLCVSVSLALSLPLPQSLSVHARIFRGLSRGSISVYLYRLFVARPRSHLSMFTWLTKSFRCFCQTFSDCMWPFQPSNPVGHCVFLFLWFLRRTPTESNPVFVAAFCMKFRSWRACKNPIPPRRKKRSHKSMMVLPVFLNKCFVNFSLLPLAVSTSAYFLSVNCHPCGLLPSFYLAIFQCSDWSTAFVCPEMAWHSENWVISHLTLAQKKIGKLNFRTRFQNIVLGSGGHSQKRRPTKTDEIVSHLSIIDNGTSDGRAPNAGQKKQQKTRHCPAAGHCRRPTLSKECGSCVRLRKETLVVCDLNHLTPITVCVGHWRRQFA